jgi:hypothetical protein
MVDRSRCWLIEDEYGEHGTKMIGVGQQKLDSRLQDFLEVSTHVTKRTLHEYEEENAAMERLVKSKEEARRLLTMNHEREVRDQEHAHQLALNEERKLKEREKQEELRRVQAELEDRHREELSRHAAEKVQALTKLQQQEDDKLNLVCTEHATATEKKTLEHSESMQALEQVRRACLSVCPSLCLSVSPSLCLSVSLFVRAIQSCNTIIRSQSLEEQHKDTTLAMQDRHERALEQTSEQHEEAQQALAAKHSDELEGQQQQLGEALAEAVQSSLEDAATRMAAEHAAAMEAKHEEHAAVLEAKAEEHNGILEEQQGQHATALEAKEESHASIVQAQAEEHLGVLEEQQGEYAQAMHEIEQGHSETMQQVRGKHKEVLEQQQSDHSQVVSAKEQAHEEAVLKRAAEHSATLEQQLEAHGEAHATDLQDSLAAASQTHASAVAEQEEELAVAWALAAMEHGASLRKQKEAHELMVCAMRREQLATLRAFKHEHADAVAQLRGEKAGLQSAVESLMLQLELKQAEHEALKEAMADVMAEDRQSYAEDRQRPPAPQQQGPVIEDGEQAEEREVGGGGEEGEESEAEETAAEEEWWTQDQVSREEEAAAIGLPGSDGPAMDASVFDVAPPSLVQRLGGAFDATPDETAPPPPPAYDATVGQAKVRVGAAELVVAGAEIGGKEAEEVHQTAILLSGSSMDKKQLDENGHATDEIDEIVDSAGGSSETENESSSGSVQPGLSSTSTEQNSDNKIDSEQPEIRNSESQHSKSQNSESERANEDDNDDGGGTSVSASGEGGKSEVGRVSGDSAGGLEPGSMHGPMVDTPPGHHSRDSSRDSMGMGARGEFEASFVGYDWDQTDAAAAAAAVEGVAIADEVRQGGGDSVVVNGGGVGRTHDSPMGMLAAVRSVALPAFKERFDGGKKHVVFEIVTKAREAGSIAGEGAEPTSTCKCEKRYSEFVTLWNGIKAECGSSLKAAGVQVQSIDSTLSTINGCRYGVRTHFYITSRIRSHTHITLSPYSVPAKNFCPQTGKFCADFAASATRVGAAGCRGVAYEQAFQCFGLCVLAAPVRLVISR